ncbi:phosphotransferase enzyme family protein [Sulfuriferula nivalis]|uniref:Aminoglycoside phosphotransferase domain-containing protein n=1 Tax=Sulfuriferula nivalis TaxID=2675298 RepID=A0A809S9I3_9PROT|nr:phosphotransferase [Sulfuriferula nivalis]BBP00952.1 hypothetical protein SFSGTM_16600 [Sulfuriferula nivalis]
MEENIFTYSQLSSQSASHLIALHYDLPTPEICTYYARGLHDNFLVVTKQNKFILRIYRKTWRTAEEIGFELDLLRFLGNQSANVSFPIHTKNGSLSFLIDTAEGQRAAALFLYADGHAPGHEITVEESGLLGSSVAIIHQLTDTFSTPYTRTLLDMSHLLDESIITVDPFLDPAMRSYLKTLQKQLHLALPSIPKEPGLYGICTGDVNPTNFHMNDKKQITLFDFDQCGYGYRAFEIGKLISSVHALKMKDDLAKAFIDGYQQIRQLTPLEVSAVPYFEMISVIWVMAITVKNADLIGHKWLEQPYWNRKLTMLKELEKVVFKN